MKEQDAIKEILDYMTFLTKRQKDINWQAAAIVVDTLLSATTPYEWDNSYFNDDQETIFLPIRIPKIITGNIYKLPKEVDRQKVLHNVAKMIFETGGSVLALKSLAEVMNIPKSEDKESNPDTN